MKVRKTIVVHGRLAAREARLVAARNNAHGLQVLTTEQLVARLAGGFAQPIKKMALHDAVCKALQKNNDLGELEPIRGLPGMVRAGAETLGKVWRAGIDLSSRAEEDPRLKALARLENTTLKELPSTMLRPADLVARAQNRLHVAPAVLGSIEFRGMTEMSPCWRSLIFELARFVPVVWEAGARETPAWLNESCVKVCKAEPTDPERKVVSCSNARHEALETLRWARELLISGTRPEEIAIATANPADYDDHFLALAADANFDLHFVHGIKAVSKRDGQAAAALAEILLRGLSQDRVRRLVALVHPMCEELKELPSNWTRIFPLDAPLLSLESWRQLFAKLEPKCWPDGIARDSILIPILELLDQGLEVANEAGEQLLSGTARAIWRRALLEGPPAALAITLADLRIDDGLDPNISVSWMPASSLAACPRRFVRLVGLTSRNWPRGIADDHLLPDHVIPLEQLDPLPISEADRRDFRTICRTTTDVIVLSRARRDAEGRQLGKSPLIPHESTEIYFRRSRVPQHAASEADRLLARPAEFKDLPIAMTAKNCWTAWRKTEITENDGLIQKNHPLVRRVLAQPQSATSLKQLLRDPLGYLWKYALGFNAPIMGDQPINLDPGDFGILVHEILAEAVKNLEVGNDFSAADCEQIRETVEIAKETVAARWEAILSLPPPVVWRSKLDEAKDLSISALTYPMNSLSGQQSWAEIPFGGTSRTISGELPWDPEESVIIPGTEIIINGFIDRLDLSDDRKQARIIDYKTGRVPDDVSDIRINHGRELQRCLYAFAVQKLVGNGVGIEVAFLYPKPGGGMYALDNPDEILKSLAKYLALARENLLEGLALPGTDASSDYNQLAFALPSNAKTVYCDKKLPRTQEMLGDMASIWEEK